MTLTELRSIVWILANSIPTRYWVHWNYPAVPEKMAIYCQGKVYEGDLIRKGFTKEIHNRKVYWVIERTPEPELPEIPKVLESELEFPKVPENETETLEDFLNAHLENTVEFRFQQNTNGEINCFSTDNPLN
ncbi:MAG TPA: hypothetical protein VK203_06210 [Nostocaceae cyanobacterium]|nr:hypothetical protein [Nostocaceae cyanobacterium]